MICPFWLTINTQDKILCIDTVIFKFGREMYVLICLGVGKLVLEVYDHTRLIQPTLLQLEILQLLCLPENDCKSTEQTVWMLGLVCVCSS